MLCFMRLLEVYVIETGDDLGSVLQAGILLPEHLADTECSDCGESIGHANGAEVFDPFCVVIDESDRDWMICVDCASSVVDGDFRQATNKPEVYESPTTIEKLSGEDYELF